MLIIDKKDTGNTKLNYVAVRILLIFAGFPEACFGCHRKSGPACDTLGNAE